MNTKKINIPLIDSNYVTRERLNLKLTSCLEKKITFISAGIGFGKTSLVSNWLLEKKMRYSWLSLDKRDNDIKIFFTNLVSSIKIFNDKLFQKFDFEYHLKNKDHYLIVDNIISEFKDINIKEFIIVLDNLDIITDVEVLSIITYLINSISHNLHLFLITKFININISDIKLALNSTSFILANDLRFTYEEINDFHLRKNINLKYSDIIEINTITEGCPLGLQFYVLFYDKNNYSIINNFQNAEIYYNLFMDEINSLDDNTKVFILETSFLSSFSLDFINKIFNFPDSNKIVDLLHKIGFIEKQKSINNDLLRYKRNT